MRLTHQVPGSTPHQERDAWGASLIEYALMLALVAVVCIGAVSYFGSSNDSGLNRSKDCLEAAYAGQAPPDNCD